MSLSSLFMILKAKGNWGHEGRKGKRGGSKPKNSMKLDTWEQQALDNNQWHEKSGDVIIARGGALGGRGDQLFLMDKNKIVAKGQAILRGQKADPEGLGSWTITGSEAIEQRKGYGTKMYMDFLKYIYPVKLSPEHELSESAKALHASLKKRSDVETLPNGSIRYKPSN